MPIRPKRPCSKSGCKELVDKGRCHEHQVVAEVQRKAVDRERDKPHLHLYGTQWKKLRAVLLRDQPLCVECRKKNVVTMAKVIDHINSLKINYIFNNHIL